MYPSYILYMDTWIKGFKMIEERIRCGANETAQLVRCHHTIMWPELIFSIHIESQVDWGPLVIPAQEDLWDSPACQPSWVNPRSLRETLSPTTKWTESQGKTTKADLWLPYVHTYIYKHPHIHTHTCMNTYTHMNMLTYIHNTYIHEHIHEHAHIHTHRHIHNPLFEGT